MDTSTHFEIQAGDGGPLAVCINDCQLDYGQPDAELMRVCFSVRCAFAEMRWGPSAAEAFKRNSLLDDDKEPSPRCTNMKSSQRS